MRFEHTQIQGVHIHLGDVAGSVQAGERLAQSLPATLPENKPGARGKLTHVLVLSDGLKVNGSDLVRGLMNYLQVGSRLPADWLAMVARFGETLVFCDDRPEKDTVGALGFYGDRLKIAFGSLGGGIRLVRNVSSHARKAMCSTNWTAFQPLGLYKKYLGEHANGLPAAGLLFPLSLRIKTGDTPVVRTILAVDEKSRV